LSRAGGLPVPPPPDSLPAMTVNFPMIIAVAAGGAVGAAGRYLSMSAVGALIGGGFPWGTLFVNIVGSFAMGVLIELMSLVWSPNVETRGFLLIGLLGAFTTFSTFSLDVVVLAERGNWSGVAGYIAASMTLCIAGLLLGLRLTRLLIT
jgi:CrcB protein